MENLLNVSEAIQRILIRFRPVETEILPISRVANRILAEDVRSDVDLPFFSNSSMDGFAVRAADVSGASESEPVALKVIADIPAGKMPDFRVGKMESARIMTGAPLPEGSDSVVPIEFTDNFHSRESLNYSEITDVLVYRPVNTGDYVRHRGIDVKSGKKVIPLGIRLRPQDIGLLAMLGFTQVPVFSRPRIAMLSTGDELVPIDMPLGPGKIYDSNAYTLAASLERDGGEALYLGIVPDREEDVRRILDKAVEEGVDLIVSTAGVSVGAFDFVRMVVEKSGKLDFWRVNMRPGKPLAFGEYRGIPFIGLPGNPVSAFVGYEVFVKPALMKLSGLDSYQRFRITVRLGEDIESDGRESYLRAVVKEVDGEWVASLTGHQGSGNLLSLVQANALLIVPSGVKSLPSRAKVDAWLIGDSPVGDVRG